MSIATLILGNPGTGKTTSLRNMPVSETLLMQVVKKPLPFRANAWSYMDKEKNPKGNIFVTDSAEQIIHVMRKTSRKIIVVDDCNYVMSNSFMRRATEKGYDKFTEMAQQTFSIFDAASNLADDVRVYLFAHTQVTEDGVTRFRTVGKLLDEKVSLDGLVTICLRTCVVDGQYLFSTRNNGSDTVKTPIGMFDQTFIENDLLKIDEAVRNYYGIGEKREAA